MACRVCVLKSCTVVCYVYNMRIEGTADNMPTAGNVTVTGCETHVTHSMLLDLASLSLSVMPPKGSLIKVPKVKAAGMADSQASAAAPTHRQAKSKLAVRVTKLTVGITNVMVGYQTAVEVPLGDQPEGGPRTLMCTQCITLQEVAGQAFPTALRGDFQVNNLTVAYQEAPSSYATMPSGQEAFPHHEVQILHATHFSLQAAPASQGHRTASLGSPAEQGPNLASLRGSGSTEKQTLSLSGVPSMAAVISLTAWHSVFHADAVIAVCKAAADFSSVARWTATRLQAAALQPEEASSSTAAIPLIQPSEAEAAVAGAATAPAEGSQAAVIKQLSKLQRLPVVMLTVQIKKWKTDVVVADHIAWGVSLPEAECKLDSHTFVAVQQQHLQAQISHNQQHQYGHEAVPSSPTHAGRSPSQAVTARSTISEAVPAAEQPRLIVRQMRLTLNSKSLLVCGEIEASLHMCPKPDKRAEVQSPFMLPGSPRRQASLGEPVVCTV